MANELNYYGRLNESGLTVSAKVYSQSGAQVGSDVSCTEVGTEAIYIGDMPTATAGQYGIRFFDSTNRLLGQGLINWDGATEVELTIPEILADTNELQQNQGDWATATGFSTFNPSIDEVITDTASRDASKADVSGLSTFDPSTETVTTDTASRDASKADVSSIETKAQADIRQTTLINQHAQTQTEISNLNDLSAGDIQSSLTAQGYTPQRASNLDNLDTTITSRASQSSVDNLQNNSSFQATIPPQIQRPETGTEIFDLFVRLFDSAGNPADPSTSNVMSIRVIAQDGTVITPTTPMTRTGVGAFEYEATLNSLTPLGQYNIFFDYDINDVPIEQVKTIQYVESVATIDQVQTTVDNIEATIGTPVLGTLVADIQSRESEAAASARETLNTSEHVTTQNAIGALNDFDPSVDTVTTDAASREASKADVSGLSTFNASTDTVTTDTASRDASKADVSSLATQASVDDIPADVDTELTSSHGSGSWQQGSSGGTVDANVTSINGTSVTGPEDLKADTTDLATKANQEAINTNVKDASLIIPAGEDLPD